MSKRAEVNTFLRNIKSCRRCSLSEHANNYPVVYRGDLNSNIVIIGEGPGKIEWEQGEPFVGPAGKLLDEMFLEIGVVNTNDLLLTNIVFCRPFAAKGSGKENYTPLSEQVSTCMNLVKEFLLIINPSVVLCCGLTSARAVLNLSGGERMKDLEGKWAKTPGGRDAFVVKHPASLLYLRSPLKEQKKVETIEILRHFIKTLPAERNSSE
jgi:DNA polymerase